MLLELKGSRKNDDGGDALLMMAVGRCWQTMKKGDTESAPLRRESSGGHQAK